MRTSLTFLLLILSVPGFVWGRGVATSGGTALLQAPSARAAALGEAFSAVGNDVVGMSYNPASIQTLEQPQAALQYHKGAINDSYGQFALGAPSRWGSVGLSVGYYNAGQFNLYDGENTRSVTLKSDFLISAGYAQKWGALSYVLTGKFLRSELGETIQANATALDVGLMWKLGDQWSLGLAQQNMGSRLTFDQSGDTLPRMSRVGLAWTLNPGKNKTMLLMDSSYSSNEKTWTPALGLETNLGPLALRGGYRGGNKAQEFSVGTGFSFKQSNLDYSFGLMSQFESHHRVSYSFRFGGAAPSMTVFSRPPVEIESLSRVFQKPKEPVVKQEEEAPVSVLHHDKNEEPTTIEPQPKSTNARRGGIPKTYVLQRNDTLQSVARKFYGSGRHWEAIYDWNEGTINNFQQMNLVGKRLKLPPKSYVHRPLFYIMKKDDTLKSIARKFYGNSYHWTKIYDKNEEVLNDFSQKDLTGKRLVLP